MSPWALWWAIFTIFCYFIVQNGVMWSIKKQLVDESIMKIALSSLIIWWWAGFELPLLLSPHIVFSSTHSLIHQSDLSGEAAGVWRSISRREEQHSSPSHSGYAGCPGRHGHPGHLQHTWHRTSHLPTWLHPHLAPLTWWCPPHDLSDPRITACDPWVTPCYSCDANDPHDPWISGGDEDGSSSPGIHTP